MPNPPTFFSTPDDVCGVGFVDWRQGGCVGPGDVDVCRLC